MQKNHCNAFDEHIYYVRKYIQKHFNMGIIEYYERVRETFKMSKTIPPLIRKDY